MTLATLEEPSAADQQKDSYNRSGPTGLTRTYTPPAGTAWAVLGLVLADAVTTDDESALVTALQALAGITTVANPRFWGQAPASVLLADHEFRVVVSVSLNCQVGYGADLRAHLARDVEVIKPPVGKKFIVINCVIPAELDQAGIASLEAAVEGITGVTTCEHLVDGVVPDNASSILLSVETKMRIDSTIVPGA